MRRSISYQYNKQKPKRSPQTNSQALNSKGFDGYFRVSFRIIPLIALKSMHPDWVTVQGNGLDTEGLVFHYKNTIASGTLLELKIMHPKITSTVNCIGKVIRVSKPRNSSLFCVTAEFIKISEQDKETIRIF
ncbi:MAG: hypothetical protein MRK01_02555 [Candidatus Scalindua sp.]|nr:hypothetical protein [Candidatus Scalindua sp.]